MWHAVSLFRRLARARNVSGWGTVSALLMGRVFYTDLPSHLRFTLLALADHASDDGGGIFVGQDRLARKVGSSVRSVHANLCALRDRGYLEQEQRMGRNGVHCYRLNLEKLPTLEACKAPVDRKPTSDRQPTSDRKSSVENPPSTGSTASIDRKPTSDKPSVTIKKKQPSCAGELLEYLNELGGRRYPPVAANLDRIAARLREYDEYTLAAMLRRKWADWRAPDRGGTDMRKFFRPKTLFAAENCAQYVGELTDLDLAWVAKQQAAQVAS